MEYLRKIVRINREGAAVALPSICSAHPDVIEASLRLAGRLGEPLLIEATSNQVNQFGGYTGLTPSDFRKFVESIATNVGFDHSKIHFGGDHLGPQAWKSEPADIAMAKAEAMMRAYVEAGFTKIHLDCSEGCRGEAAQVSDEISALRSARLASACEVAAADPNELSYIVGTEVPPPGGARAGESETIKSTEPKAAISTLEAQNAAFSRAGLDAAWLRVACLVVQPGLEFGPEEIDHFPLGSDDCLSAALDDYPHIAFEAHSTDYQHPAVFPDLAHRHFAVQKVGPALTFAWREALFALDHIRRWSAPTATSISDVLDRLMEADPGPWRSHYQGEGHDLRILRIFGYADRIRYFWTHPEAQAATSELLCYFDSYAPPEPLVRQYVSEDVLMAAESLLKEGVSFPKAILLASVEIALHPYFFKADYRQ